MTVACFLVKITGGQLCSIASGKNSLSSAKMGDLTSLK